MRRAVLLALLLSACMTREPVQVETARGEPIVHAVLRAGTDTVAVLLQRVVRGDEASAVGVSGAQVEIATGAARTRLAEAPAGFPACVQAAASSSETTPAGALVGCYAGVLPEAVRSGNRYELHIRERTGALIRGETTVPAPPLVQAPVAHATFEVPRNVSGFGAGGVIRARLSAPAHTGASAALAPVTAFEGGRAHPGRQCEIPQLRRLRRAGGGASDSAEILLRGPVRCYTTNGSTRRLLTLDSLQAMLLVATYDSATAHYTEALEAGIVPREQASAGLQGALGVFGASAAARRPVTLIGPRRQ